MTTAASNPATLGKYAETIRPLHLIDKKNQATQTWRAIVLGTLLAVLGSAALTGCASTGSEYARGEATDCVVLPDSLRNEHSDRETARSF